MRRFGPTAGTPTPPTIASAVDREISGAEKQLVEAVEVMPEDHFDSRRRT